MPTQTETGLCRKRLHEMTAANTYLTTVGTRRCRECVRIADKRRNVRDYDKRKEAQRARWHGLPAEQKRSLALARHGLTVADYNRLFEEQGGACAICSTSEPGGKSKTHFAVDHDHATGVIRGLLCGHCNVMLGNASDEPARLRAAAAYLERDR